MSKFVARINTERIYHTSPVDILLLIRKGIARDWWSLCNELDVEPDNLTTPGVHLNGRLENLVAAKILECRFQDMNNLNKNPSLPDHYSMYGASFKIAPAWTNIQEALHLSLSMLSELSSAESIIVKPTFGIPRSESGQKPIFVVMPFDDELKHIYSDHIQKVAKSAGVAASRADDFFKAGAIVSDTWNAIYNASVIIADCTGRNPNVFYELGMAHTLGRPVVIITQDINDVPFDIRHLRIIEYECSERGMVDFENNLSKSLKYELEKMQQ